MREQSWPDIDLMRDVVGFMRHFGDRYHHAREDVAFDLLARSMPALAPQLEFLREEHTVIADLGDDLHALLSHPLQRNQQALALLEAGLAAYLSVYHKHVEAEENDVLPRAALKLDAKDWASVDKAAPPGPDPFQQFGSMRHNPTFGSESEARYRGLAEKIKRRRQLTFGHVAPAPRVETTPMTNSVPVVGAAPRGDSGQRNASRPAPGRRKSSLAARAGLRPSVCLLRQSIGFAALVLAFLKYYFLDISLQIQQLPAIDIFLF